MARIDPLSKEDANEEQKEALEKVEKKMGSVANILGAVALNLFTNTFNHVVETERDFPEAPQVAAAEA